MALAREGRPFEGENPLKILPKKLPKTLKVETHKTNKEQTKCDVWADMCFEDFQKLENRPKPDTDFGMLWDNYRKSCRGGRRSDPGNKQRAWFEYILLIDSDFEAEMINAAVNKYSLKKTLSDSKQAQLSNVLRDKDLLQQQLDEIDEEQKKSNSTRSCLRTKKTKIWYNDVFNAESTPENSRSTSFA